MARGMGTLIHMYAGIAVSDLDTAIAWYTRLFDRAPDHRAGDEVLWDVTEQATLFIERKQAGVGAGHVTFGVTGLDELVARLAARGVAHEPIETYGSGVRHVSIRDPDANLIGFAERPG
jgi:catechol 2,3-dioxygenase-like lactoylglutathione lyase family enzyme